MEYKEFCEQLIELVGGKENIQSVTNCMTRLRFKLKDRDAAKTEEIKELTDVIDVVSNEVAYQVIIGTQVQEIRPEMNQILGLTGENKQSETGEKEKFVTMALRVLSESMGPILIPIMAAGLLAGILSLISLTGLVSAEDSTYMILDSIRQAVFFFLPVLIAISFARNLDVNEYLAVTIALTLLSETINGVKGLDFLGLKLPETTYSNSFFPIILSIIFMKYVGKVLEKVMPKALQYFFNPVLILIITLPITLILFGPLGTYIGEGLNFVFDFVGNTFGSWSVVMLYAALQPFLITIGAGNFIIPIFMNSYATLGYDPVFTVAWIISDIAVCGAVLGYFFRSKDQKQKQLFATTAFSAFMGVTEPAIYGVFVKYRRPYLAVIIGGGLGGLFAGLMKVIGYAPVSLFGLASFIGQNNYKNFYMMIVAVIIGFVGAGIAAFILGIPDDEKVKGKSAVSVETNEEAVTKLLVKAPVKGKNVVLSNVNDKAFASSALGKGLGIEPEEDLIHAPVNGEVVSLFPTSHAIGIKTEYGVEILIHIGINTVELEGKYFESFVKQGDQVAVGDPILRADMAGIRSEGYDPVVITVITNTADYLDVLPSNDSSLSSQEDCLTVVV
ncbi:beta-glucoside-specific PTS transporter subunit IIABC [Candidatus Enterococcus ferrettii]|uniref:PTS system, beta-glucoside-specific IIA component n=1 Tax=Candidatus Enterococcus ferrettii TaxID=2815324 RepID=A0ABV0EWL1_9ENTE|nr:beta-glucoside-specific PTS transporter subunit IIABC [Enterococcus sp. 665A]MBO1342229.1 PTS glucose transporter subunit IIA [Enterococcus sp. 665A]